MIILSLERGKVIENNLESEKTDFCLLLDLCFDISDYFTLTVHRYETFSPYEGKESNNFFQEMQPYLVKNFRAFNWGIFGNMRPAADVYIFKCENQAKSVIQKYFDDLYLQVPVESSDPSGKTCGKFQDLCFFKEDNMTLATVSHEDMCCAYLPDEEMIGRFLDICEWTVCKKDISSINIKYPIEDILFGLDYKTQPLYMFLQSMRTGAIYNIGKKSLERLYYYVKGYCDKEINTQDQSMRRMLMLIDDYFCDYVCSYYDCKDVITPTKVTPYTYWYEVAHWMEIITEKSTSEEEAFDKFYELLDDFLDQNWEDFKKKFSNFELFA